MGATEITYGAVAIAGIISFLSPCVLPIVPAYLSFVVGTSFNELTGEDETDADAAVGRRVVMSALAFVLGFSTVFVTLGATASAVNALIVENIDVISKVAGAVIVVFGLHYAGLLRIPYLYREARFHPDKFENEKDKLENGTLFEYGLNTANQGSGMLSVSNLKPNPRDLIADFIRYRLENQEGYVWRNRGGPAE